MRKAFAFLTSLLSNINKLETKASTKTTSPDIQKENNKSQIITSNIKNDKNENPIKKNNHDINPLNKIKKNISNDLKKPTLKESAPELKKLESTRKTSSRTASSTTVSTSKHSSSNRRKKLSVIKNNDSDGDGESENASETNSDDEEEEEDDDHVPLGLRFQHSRSVRSNYPSSSSQRNQEYYDDDIQIRNVSGMLLHHNRSMTQDSNMEKYHYLSSRNLSSPMPTTPPLIHTSRELLQPRLHYFRERRFSSSASSSSSTSVDSNGSRYYRKNNPIITPNSSQRNNRYSTYSLPYWNEYEYDDCNPNGYYDDELYDNENRIINIPGGDLPPVPNTPTERMRRVSLNTSSPRPRNDSFSRMYSGSTTTTRRSNDSNRLVAGANPPPNKHQKEATKKMSTSEYHRYQQEMVITQYLKHGISPIVDDSIPVHSEPLNNNSRGPTLMQVQSMMVNVPSTRPKRLSVIDRGYSGSYSSSGSNTPPAELVRKTSYYRTTSDYGSAGSGAGNGGVSSHRRTHSESNVQKSSRFSTRQHHHYHHNTPLHLQHQSSSSSSSTYVSSSGSGGPPTPTSRRSSMMFGSNVNGSRSSTPSSIGSGYIFEKEKRRKSVLRE